MAFRGSAVQANTSTSNTVVLTVGSIGIQSGDIVFLYGAFGGSAPDTISATGFSAVPGISNQYITGTNGNTFAALYKIAGSSEPSTYTINVSVTDYHAAQCRVYSGRSGTFTAVATTNVASTAYPQTYALNGVTAAVGDDIVLLGANTGNNGLNTTFTYTPPSGYANGALAQSIPTQYVGEVWGSDKVNASAGATGTIAGTMSVSVAEPVGGYGAYVLSLAASVPSSNTAPMWLMFP